MSQMDLYIVQWANCEVLDDTGVKCFNTFADARWFLVELIHKNYPKDHTDNNPSYEEIELGDIVDPEALFPYTYKISRTEMVITFK